MATKQQKTARNKYVELMSALCTLEVIADEYEKTKDVTFGLTSMFRLIIRRLAINCSDPSLIAHTGIQLSTSRTALMLVRKIRGIARPNTQSGLYRQLQAVTVLIIQIQDIQKKPIQVTK